MEKVKTLNDLRITLQIRIDQVSKHSYKTLQSINLEADEKQKVLDLYQYTQYIERKAFEMRFFIDEYIRETNAVITSAIGIDTDINNSIAPNSDFPGSSIIKKSKMNDIEEDHPF